ncbi:MAG: phosphatase PAP2 family protein [Ferruginibacter sp.]|nr:phosphatase PAP2 family protein [Ferruginibacter sp.]
MRFFKKLFLAFIAISPMITAQAQYTDTSAGSHINGIATSRTTNWNLLRDKKQVGRSSFIVPGILIAYGFSSLESDGLKSFNGEVKEELWEEHPHKKTKMDNYLQYSPAVAVYGLNALGIKGRNNFRDRSMIYLLSNAFLSSTVFGIKKLTHELRPDGTDYFSFPSGHTAEAFASAEFLRQEYKDVSPWYGIAGYVAAGATGALRMYNNRHWMSDVLAGAGIGIASTKLAYWIYPVIKRKLFKDKPVNTMILPFYQSRVAGIAMVYNFH